MVLRKQIGMIGKCIQNPLSPLCSWGYCRSWKWDSPSTALKRVSFPQTNCSHMQVCSVRYPNTVVPGTTCFSTYVSISHPSQLGQALNKAPRLPVEVCQFFNTKPCWCIGLHNSQITQYPSNIYSIHSDLQMESTVPLPRRFNNILLMSQQAQNVIN